MPIQTSGTIRITDIVNEFGGSAPHNMSEYYRGGSRVPNIPANNNVPTSGRINLADFYGARFGTPIRIDIIGGGGGGGGGAEDGDPPGSADDGGDSWVRLADGNTQVVQVAGGAGGENGGSGGTFGSNGQGTAFGRGGFSQNARNDGFGAPYTSWGASGGGAGGDSGGKGDAQGNGGAGGRAGTRNDTTYYASGTVNVRVGAGGLGGQSTWNGGAGAGGRVRIRDGRDGDRTFTDGNRRRTRNFVYRVD